MRICKLSIILFLLFVNLWHLNLAEGIGIDTKCESIDSAVVKELLNSQKIGIVDYRISEDYYRGHIKGAILFPLNDKNALGLELEKQVLKWRREKLTGIIVGDSGSKAEILCRNIKVRFKYKKVYSLKGGMKNWNGHTYKENFDIFRLTLLRIWSQKENRSLFFLVFFMFLLAMFRVFIKKL